MTKISQYSTDVNITGNDKWIGSDAQNFLITKNFTPNNLANYFNGNNVIDIGTSIRYIYQTLDPGEAREQGTISFETEIGPQVNFSAITTFLIAKNSLKQNDVSQYLDFLIGSDVLLSRANNINIFGYYKITSLQPWIPNPNFFVVTVNFLEGNGFISEDLDYLISLVDKSSGSGSTVWGNITGDIQDQTDLINYISSQVTAPTLQEVLAEGNTTGGENIVINNADTIQLENSSTLKKGTYDFGADGGISRICGVGFEDMWQAGIRHVFDSNGLIRNSTNCFNIVPDSSFDNTLRFKVDSLWTLDDGTTYKCTDATTGAAVWELQGSGIIPTLQEVTDEGSTTTNQITVGGITSGNLTSDGFQLLISDDLDAIYNFMYTPYVGLYIGNGTDTAVELTKTGTVNFTTPTGAAVLNSTLLTGVRNLELPDADGTLALTTDIAAQTLQEVLDEGNSAVDRAIYFSNTANDFETSINEYGDGKINLKSVSNDILTDIDAGLIYLGNFGLTDYAIINKDGIMVDSISYPFPSGASSPLATLADIPTGGGIPHATASGTDTYTATITGVTAYNDADAFLIRFTNGNTTGATLNINALGAKNLYRNNDGALIGGDIINGGEMLCIYNTSLNGFQLIGTAPNSLFAYVTNADSVTLTKGMPVYAFGGTGDRMTVKRANNTGDATSAQTVGLVLSTSIAANQKGLIMMQGLLDELSILPTSTWSDGDAVYLGATAGTITNVKPFAPNHLVYLGVVTTASNGAAGRMYVRVQNGYELQELHNVQAQSPSFNDTLWYDNTVSPAQWKTASIPTILGFTPENVANKQTDLTASATKYPTVNAVNTGLALKQNILSYTPYRNIQTSQTAHTGTTVETLIFTATIPAGSFNSADIIKVLFGANKTTALGTYVLRLRVNTTNTISGAPTIATYNGTATAQANIMQRNYNLNGGNLYGFGFTSTAMSDIIASGAGLSSTSLNPANTFYIFATIQLANASDSMIGNMFSISN